MTDGERQDAVALALDHLRILVNSALELFEDRELSVPSVRKLKRTLRIYHTASRSCLDDAYVPKELLRWIRHLSRFGGRRRALQLVRFLADEADPNYVVAATQEWTSTTSSRGSHALSPEAFDAELLPVLQTLLIRAVQRPAAGAANEFSGALSKLRQARERLMQNDGEESNESSGWESELRPSPNIWARMATGMVPVLK
jgi:hypothetical protein